MNPDIKALQKKIGYSFKNSELLITALTHPSFLNENKEERDSYQRLEFLGDAILEYVVSDYLFAELTDIREGRLTEIRAAMVRTESLAKCAEKIDLGQYLYISKGEEQNQGRANENLLADSFEALLAAVYLDSQSIKPVREIFHRFVKESLNVIISDKLYLDPKTQLQEYLQSTYKVTPSYQLLKQELKNNLTSFEVGVYLENKCLATGVGKNKKLAEQSAAKNALGKIKTV